MIKAILFTFLLILGSITQAQSFWSLSWPEKLWVSKHPFVAVKAKKIAREAVYFADSIQKVEAWRNQASSGRKDAFRHAYWMFFTTIELGVKRAKSLGAAHERGNLRDLKKGRIEEGEIPDNRSIEMDQFNNVKAVELAKSNRDLSKNEGILLLLREMKTGSFQIIKQDSLGRYIDSEGNSLDDSEWQAQENSPRILVSSAY